MSAAIESIPANVHVVEYLKSYFLGRSEVGGDVHPEVLFDVWPELIRHIPNECGSELFGLPILVHPTTHVIFAFAAGWSPCVRLDESASLLFRKQWFTPWHMKGRPVPGLDHWWKCGTEKWNSRRCLAAYRLAYGLCLEFRTGATWLSWPPFRRCNRFQIRGRNTSADFACEEIIRSLQGVACPADITLPIKVEIAKWVDSGAVSSLVDLLKMKLIAYGVRDLTIQDAQM